MNKLNKINIFLISFLFLIGFLYPSFVIDDTIYPNFCWGTQCNSNPTSCVNYFINTDLYFSTNIIISTNGNTLDGSDPLDLPDGAIICASEVTLDSNPILNEFAFGNQFMGTIPYFSIPDWNNGLKPLDGPPITQQQIQISESLYNQINSGPIVFSLTHPNNIFNKYEEPFNYYKEKCSEPTAYLNNKKGHAGVVCYGNLIADINSVPIILELGNPDFDISYLPVGDYIFELSYSEVQCLGLGQTNIESSTNNKVYVYRDENLFPYTGSKTPFVLHVDDPQIIINSMMITDVEGNPEIVINPGQTKDIIIHLFLNRESMAFNITDITATPSDFIFTPDTPFNISVPTPPAGEGAYEYTITGQLTAPEIYTNEEISLRVFFDTNLPVCNDQTGEWPIDAPITQGPDLVVNLSAGGATGIIYQTEGATTTIDVDTINIGSLETGSESTTFVTSNDASLFTNTGFLIPNLNEGANQINSFDFTCPPGINMNITFEACADYYDEVIEVNENDNCDNITIVCDAYTNLRVKSDIEPSGFPPIRRAPCIVNETQTIDLTTYSNSICSQNASWTLVELKQGTTILNTTRYSVPPMPNLWMPNSFLFIPQREADTTTPFGNDWGTCTDLADVTAETYTEVTHKYSYEINIEGTYQIQACADIDNEVNEGSETDNCLTLWLSCVPPAPGNITAFCTDLNISNGGMDNGNWGVINDGSYDITTTIIPTYSGSINPSPSFPASITEMIRAGDIYSKNARWTCGDTSAITTYTIFAEWTDPHSGNLMNDTAICTIRCGIVLACEDYL
ncbi:MAG: CARDB domain-containing protein [Candidatus Micrarchaeia archaeon]